MHQRGAAGRTPSINQDEAGDYDPWIEIYNASPTTIDLGGMYLTNDFLTPDLWRFPLGTSLCSGCWILVWADDEPGEGPLHANFALNPLGGLGRPVRRRAGG